MRGLLTSFCAISIASVLATGVATAQSKAQRHLVYDFSVGVTNDTHDTNMSTRSTGLGNGGSVHGTGDTQYGGNASDKGEITVDVMGLQSDGGLVTTVSESARTNRSSPPTSCVAYANTYVACAQGQVNPEEMAVLRTMNPKFFDTSNGNPKAHWHFGDAGGPVSIDFTAAKRSDGLLDVTSDRQENSSGAHSVKATTSAKYIYDATGLVAKTLTEYQTIREQDGPGQYTNLTVQTNAQLVTDTKS